jgi:tRNA modification GTPase
MDPPQTYTGEEVAELHGHGSPVVLQEVVRGCLARGARLAGPGEFTKRAFLNGKMDLVQAEAVAELIAAEGSAEAVAARRRMEGRLSEHLQDLRRRVATILAECEAAVDFPEEGLTAPDRTRTEQNISEIQALIKESLGAYLTNQRLAGGVVVAIAGPPNAGKSSLFNALLRSDRAIVTGLPGTTRDVLREELVLEGRRVRLLDTAGLHDGAKDEAERIGIVRTRSEAAKADLVLWVRDPTADGGGRPDEAPGAGHWTVWNKIDLGVSPAPTDGVTFRVSATRGDGIDDLRAALGRFAVDITELPLDGGISNDRQQKLLVRAGDALGRAEVELRREASPEFVAFELREAHRALSRILGEDDGIEGILGEIFARFCIGK